MAGGGVIGLVRFGGRGCKGGSGYGKGLAAEGGDP